MVTFKALVLSHQKRRDGTYNVKIRVTHNRKHKYIKTALYAGKNDLTKSLKIKNYLILDATDEIIKAYRTRCTEIGTALNDYSVEKLCANLEEGASKEEWKVNFFEYAETVINKKKTLIEACFCGLKGMQAKMSYCQTSTRSFCKVF